LPVRAKTRTGADFLGMFATGIRAVFVDRTTACLGVEEMAIAIGPARQREESVPEIEMFDDMYFLEAFGELLRVGFQIKLVENA
jgi:hypothetical protein